MQKKSVIAGLVAASLMVLGTAAQAQQGGYGDRDRDGIANQHDRDRDGDGIRNSRDSDRDGDGIRNISDPRPDRPDVARRLYSPRGDLDLDGVANRDDRDRDGDGVSNRRDRHPDDRALS